MSLTVWDLVPATRPEFDDEPQCLSRLFPDTGLEIGARTCRVNHFETREVLHGALVAGHWDRWSDTDAADSLAKYRASTKPTGPVCDGCFRSAELGGRCWHCAAAELAADDIETEMENVA